MEKTQQLAEQFIEALHRLEEKGPDELRHMIELFSPDAVLINSALRLAGREYRGLEGLARFWSEYRATFGAARSEFSFITTNEQAAGLFWTTQGTDPHGQPVEYEGVSLLVFDQNDKIRMFRGYYDTRQLERQANVG